jgi:hypothetical protein
MYAAVAALFVPNVHCNVDALDPEKAPAHGELGLVAAGTVVGGDSE